MAWTTRRPPSVEEARSAFPLQGALPGEETAPGWRRTFASLESRDFRFLWVGTLLMMAGMQMEMVAMGYLVYDLTSSPLLLGFVEAGFAVPMLALSLFGGAVADRVERKRVVQWGQAVAAVVALFIAVSIVTGTVTWLHLLGEALIEGVVFSFMGPARQAIIPQLVGTHRLTNAMALNAAGMGATTLVAPSIAGVAYALIGPGGVYFLIGAVGLAAALVTGFVANRGSVPARDRPGMLGDIGAGLAYIRHNNLVLALLVIGLATALFSWPFRTLLPVVVVDVYHRGPEAMGVLISVLGAGSLVGSMALATLRPWRRGLLLIGGCALSGAGLLLVAALPLYGVALVLLVFIGLGDASRWTLNQAMIMEEVEDVYRGRVSSVFMMSFGLMPLGVLPASIAAQLVGIRPTVAMLAVLLLATAGVVLVTQRRLREKH